MERLIYCVVSSRARKGNYHDSANGELFGGTSVKGYVVREVDQLGAHMPSGYAGIAWSEHDLPDESLVDVRTVEAGDEVTFSKDRKVLVGNEFKLVKRGQKYTYPNAKAEILGDPATIKQINKEDILRMQMAKIANQAVANPDPAQQPSLALEASLREMRADQQQLASAIAGLLSRADATPPPFEVGGNAPQEEPEESPQEEPQEADPEIVTE